MRGTEQKSYLASAKTFQREWVVVDVKDRILGRVSTRIAHVLMGKHKPTYTPFLDTGDHVIVLNADKIRLSGKKASKKTYNTFSGYPSGNRFIPFEKWFSTHPERVVEHAVLEMLPRGTLGRQMFKKLHVYKGDKHPHAAQQPKTLEIK
jgi:large subunit ribosomal protein L13